MARVTVTQIPVEVAREDAVPRITVTQMPVEVAREDAVPRITVTQMPVEVAREDAIPRITVTQMVVEVAWVVPAPAPTCTAPAPAVPDSIASKYYIKLRNQTGDQVALFDDFLLEYGKEVNGVGYYSLTLNDDDERKSLFETDGWVEVVRTVPACGVDWYTDFYGLHRDIDRKVDSNGERFFISTGVDFNDLLTRGCVAFKAGTIRSDKNAAAETVMKEYVNENNGPLAIMGGVVGRLHGHVLPSFSIDADTGAGIVWTGSRAYENLLDVLQDISKLSDIDFAVEPNGVAQFVFKTYVNQMGTDRTTVGLNPSSGKNTAGNAPVIFNLLYGNIQDSEYKFSRMSEANAVLVLGKGELSTRNVIVREDTFAEAASPWNSREISRPGTSQEYTYQLETMGDEILKEMAAKETFTFTAMQQPSSLYGKHYFLGDRVTLVFDDLERHARITGVKVVTSNDKGEEITLDFEIPS